MINVGSTDKKIRLVAGVALAIISFLSLGGFSTALGIVAIVVGLVLVVTALVNFCPAYKLLGVKTTAKAE